MELIVILGSENDYGQELANRLRAHGYHYFSPQLFFVDDCGDSHINTQQLDQADHWCEHHAALEMQRHNDVVIQGIYLNPTLISQAKKEGYHVVVLACNEKNSTCDAEIQALITTHDKAHPSLLKRLFG